MQLFSVLKSDDFRSFSGALFDIWEEFFYTLTKALVYIFIPRRAFFLGLAFFVLQHESTLPNFSSAVKRKKRTNRKSVIISVYEFPLEVFVSVVFC